MQDILYDPQTSGGLLIAVDGRDAEALREEIPGAAIIGYVTEREESAIVLEMLGHNSDLAGKRAGIRD